MKTWEMIKELTEHPKKKFKAINENRQIEIHGDTLINSFSMTNFIITTKNLNWKWEEVREPVTWKEAFKAGLEGKKIKPDAQHSTYPDYEELHYALMYLGERPGYFKEIMLDNWYIE